MSKDALDIASNLFAQTGREIFAPRINSLLLKLERKIKLASSWKEQFEDYWMEMTAKFYTVNSVVLGHTQRSLESIYVPLELQLESSDSQIIKVDSFPKVLIDHYGKLLIKDSIGMGKTTMLKYMFLNVIAKESGFPVFVELRNLRCDHGIAAEIQAQLSRLNKKFDYRLMLDFFRAGGFVFFLDGFDEIEESERGVIVKDLIEFVSKANLNQFVMTSREENALVGFGDFIGAKVLPLSKTNLIYLLQKYGGSAGKTKDLVRQVLEGSYSEIEDFLHIPLLAGLLFRAYMESNMREIKLYQLCCNIFPVFYDQHDLSKDGCYIHQKRLGVSPDDLERILDYMGLYTISSNSDSFSELEFYKMIRFAVTHSALSVKESDFLHDLTVCIPIFCKDGTQYRWIHSSLCSYYFARYIYFESKEKARDILQKIFSSKRILDYVLTIRMFFEMDAAFFDKYVICPCLSSLLSSYRKTRRCWSDFIEESVASSDVFLMQMQIMNGIHPELFEQSIEDKAIANHYCLSEVSASVFISQQNTVMLLDDNPDVLISGL